jgi:hypothetical protein
MAIIHVDVEGHRAFEFGDEEQLTAGAIEIRIRTSLRLQGGSVRKGLRAFGVDRILEAGVYTFDEFTVEGKCHHVWFILYAAFHCSNDLSMNHLLAQALHPLQDLLCVESYVFMSPFHYSNYQAILFCVGMALPISALLTVYFSIN